jgi:hypothetical protein
VGGRCQLWAIGTQRVRSWVASSPPDSVRKAFPMDGSLVGNRCLRGWTSFSTDFGRSADRNLGVAAIVATHSPIPLACSTRYV